MESLRGNDLRRGMRLLQEVSAAAGGVTQFARRGIEELVRLAPSEMTTLSVCDLAAGRRGIAAALGDQLSAEDRAAFDRHFHEHPLVRYHGARVGSGVQRISDSVPLSASGVARCTTSTTAGSESTMPWRCRCTSTRRCW